MGKSVIRVSCADQVLKITEAPVVAAGGLNEVSVEFSFCQKWDGFVKTATFYRDEEEVYYAILDENDTCIVPWEVCFEAGTFYFGVFGEKDTIRRTSNVVRYKVKKGAITSDMMPSDPTPGLYDKIAEEVAKMKEEVESTLDEATKHNIASIEKTGSEGLVDVYTITFVDGSTQTYTVTNGEPGERGEQGEQGDPGYTPVKGEDYFTKEDKDELVEAVKAEIGDTTATVTGVSITEATDGSVTMVNTLSDGGTETIVISADTDGNPSGLTYNGIAIPLTYTKETGVSE